MPPFTIFSYFLSFKKRKRKKNIFFRPKQGFHSNHNAKLLAPASDCGKEKVVLEIHLQQSRDFSLEGKLFFNNKEAQSKSELVSVVVVVVDDVVVVVVLAS